MNAATLRGRGSWLTTVAMAVATALAGTAAQADTMIAVSFSNALAANGTYSTGVDGTAQIADAPLTAGWYGGQTGNLLTNVALRDTAGVLTSTQISVSTGHSWEAAVTPSNSSGTTRLMSQGLQGGRTANNSSPDGTTQIQFTNLNTTFPSGYKVYVAFSDIGHAFQSAVGTWYASESGYTDVKNTPSTTAGLNAFASIDYGAQNNYGFNGTWLPAQNNNSNANYTVFGTDETPLTRDTLVLTNWLRGANHSGGTVWAFNLTNGVQIVGVPEPASVALSGTAVAVAAGGMLLRRRRRGRRIA